MASSQRQGRRCAHFNVGNFSPCSPPVTALGRRTAGNVKPCDISSCTKCDARLNRLSLYFWKMDPWWFSGSSRQESMAASSGRS